MGPGGGSANRGVGHAPRRRLGVAALGFVMLATLVASLATANLAVAQDPSAKGNPAQATGRLISQTSYKWTRFSLEEIHKCNFAR